MKHVIEMWESNDRDQWECDCGHGGSARAGEDDIHAEKHVPDGDQIVYRYPSPEES